MKLLGIDVLKGYVGCFGARVLGFGTTALDEFGNETGFATQKIIREGNVILDNDHLYNPLGAWQGKLIIPLVSNFCFMSQEPIVRRD
ncbi:MAG: hypothetical protein LBH40_00780 [Alphaproteobacteria bacterium]|jgi:hypothetical protein|nr:hypothetical protein [Alphaproteobacteria bacterium]